jgi:hypothetical protein
MLLPNLGEPKVNKKDMLMIRWLLASVLIAQAAVAGADQSKVVEPFNGVDLTGWQVKHESGSRWVVGQAAISTEQPRELVVIPATEGNGELVNASRGGVDIFTADEFGDCLLTIEVMVPQGSNSGIYLMGNYEIQVLDSWGRDPIGPGDMGGLYGAAAPLLNASKAPGQWQEFVIDFQAPRFVDGKKVSNAVFKKVTLNGKVIHENIEMKGPTGGSLGRGEQPTGPLMFQGDHGPVAFRNIRIVPQD